MEQGTQGGARSDAGGPLPGTTPLALLWQFLAQRCGPELADEAHRYFNEQQRLYQQWRRDEEIRARRKQEHR